MTVVAGHRTKKPAHEDHAVLTRTLVASDGTRRTALRVYCRRQERSMPLETCRACAQCLDVIAGEHGVEETVRCRPSDGRHERAAVGAMLRDETLCVAPDVDVTTLTVLVANRGLSTVFVVDVERVVGVVREIDLRASALQSIAPGGIEPGAVVMDVARPIRPILESTPLRSALIQMAVGHLRRAPIVTPRGELLGSLGDVEGLRWLAALARAGNQGGRP